MLTQNDFIWEDFDAYHGKASEYLSSHQLMDYIKCPYGYLRKRQMPKPENEVQCFAIGRAAHQLILEGLDVFSKNYIIGGPINEKTGKPYGTNTQKYQDWLAESGGKQGINQTDFDMLETVNFSVQGHKEAAQLLEEGFPESVVRAEYCGVQCQIRIDWFNPNIPALVDLKTCRNIDRFPFDFKEFLYANQMSFYREVFNARFGAYPDVYIIATEVSEPFRTGVYKLSEGTLNEARAINESNIPRFIESKKTGQYPTLYEEMRIL